MRKSEATETGEARKSEDEWLLQEERKREQERGW